MVAYGLAMDAARAYAFGADGQYGFVFLTQSSWAVQQPGIYAFYGFLNAL